MVERLEKTTIPENVFNDNLSKVRRYLNRQGFLFTNISKEKHRPTTERIRLDDVAKQAPKRTGSINHSVFNLYEVILEKVEPQTNNTYTLQQVICIESFEKMLAGYLTMFETLMHKNQISELESQYKEHHDFLKEITERKAAIHAFSLYAGASLGKDIINELGINAYPQAESIKTNLFMPVNDLTYYLAKTVASVIAKESVHKEVSDVDLIELLQDTYTGLINNSLAVKDAYKKAIADCNIGSPVEMHGVTFQGFSCYITQEKPKKKPRKIWFKDIVGNTDFKQKLESLINTYIVFFDPNGGEDGKGDNPAGENMSAPQTIFMRGPPGTGKTMTLTAMVNETHKACEEYGIDVEMLVIDSEIKSKWYGESEEKIRGIFSRVREGKKFYIIACEDIDALVSARESSNDGSAEKGVLQEILNQLEGVTSNERGNFILFTSSNKPESIDQALGQRIMQNQVMVAGPETPEHYIEFFKLNIDNRQIEEISDEAWKRIADACFFEHYDPAKGIDNKRLTGREARNITTTLAANCSSEMKISAEDIRELKAIDRSTEEGKKEFNRIYASFMPKVTEEKLLRAIGEYKEGLEENRKLEEKEILRRKVNEYTNAAKAQYMARSQEEFIDIQDKLNRLDRLNYEKEDLEEKTSTPQEQRKQELDKIKTMDADLEHYTQMRDLLEKKIEDLEEDLYRQELDFLRNNKDFTKENYMAIISESEGEIAALKQDREELIEEYMQDETRKLTYHSKRKEIAEEKIAELHLSEQISAE